jgi:hypothetical protein
MSTTRIYLAQKYIYGRIKNTVLYRPLVFIFKILLRVLIKFFRIVALTGHGSDICLENGFLPLRVHFYSPVPDIKDLEQRKVWDFRSRLPGIDFNSDNQIRLIKEIGADYADECNWPMQPVDDSVAFYLDNPSFSYGCAAATHCLIRKSKPRTVIEIGSGMSSRVISKALTMNMTDTTHPADYIIVDPYPGDDFKNGKVKNKSLVSNRVELLDPDFFSVLEEDDILFIDSGHCVRIGGDVNFLFLEVLPNLNPGVMIHIHDIGIPYEYPETYARSETFRQFWTEQYLLQAFLCFNSEFEILLAMNYLMTDHLETFKSSFPHYTPGTHLNNSGSFWIRRKSN